MSRHHINKSSSNKKRAAHYGRPIKENKKPGRPLWAGNSRSKHVLTTNWTELHHTIHNTHSRTELHLLHAMRCERTHSSNINKTQSCPHPQRENAVTHELQDLYVPSRPRMGLRQMWQIIKRTPSFRFVFDTSVWSPVVLQLLCPHKNVLRCLCS